MKTVLRKSFRLACLALAIGCAQEAASGQQPTAAQSRVRLQMQTLDRLAARADKTVTVVVDENMLGLARSVFANPKDEQAREVAAAIAGLQGVYVRVFEFESEGQWTEADIADIRRQTGEPGWSPVVDVWSKKNGRKVEVFLRALPGKIGGLIVLATEPKQLLVVNMVGDVDLQKLTSLQGQFGIPDIDIGGDDDDDDDRRPKRETAKPATKKPE